MGEALGKRRTGTAPPGRGRSRADCSEIRMQTVGHLNGRMVLIIWTQHGVARRVISAPQELDSTGQARRVVLFWGAALRLQGGEVLDQELRVRIIGGIERDFEPAGFWIPADVALALPRSRAAVRPAAQGEECDGARGGPEDKWPRRRE